MSQTGSPLMGSQTIQAKYRKALAEIQKIHAANRVLKSESEAAKVEWQQRQRDNSTLLQNLQQRSHDLEEEISSLKEVKIALEKVVEELRMSNTELKRQRSCLEREVAYLNLTITDQSAQIKKMSAFKGEKNLTALITSYQEREIAFRRDISQQQQLIKTFKDTLGGVEKQLVEERRLRHKLEDTSINLKSEIAKYKEVNAGLLGKQEAILHSILLKNSQGKGRHRETETALAEIGRQLQLIRSSRIEQQSMVRTTVAIETYNKLLQEKRTLEDEQRRMRGRLQEWEQKVREAVAAEEQLKLAMLQNEQLQEECNVLRSKLVVVETNNLMNEWQEDGRELKEKNLPTSQNDSHNIKNSADSSHFQLMKDYILEMKEKLAKALLDKKQFEKKYRFSKEKLNEKTEQAHLIEQQNSVLRSKLEGFERLTERLHLELERSLHVSEEEMAKMKTATDAILAKQNEDTKTASAQLQAHLQAQLQRFGQEEQHWRSEVSALQEELSGEKMRGGQMQEQLEQVNEFLTIYKAKFDELQAEHSQTQEMHTVLAENALRFEQLYREQRQKNQALEAQKQSLSSKLTQTTQQLEKRLQQESEMQQREAAYENELARLRTDLVQARSEVAQLHNNLRVAVNQVEESRMTLSGAARSEGGYHPSFNQERQRNKILESELAAVKEKAEKSITQAQRAASLEDALSAKTDELNDFKRKVAGFERQVAMLQSELKGIRSEYESTKRENVVLRARLTDTGNDARKTLEARQEEGHKRTRRLSEELAQAHTDLREEKRTLGRVQVELEGAKEELRRVEELLQQGRIRQVAISEQLRILRSTYESTCEENNRLKSELNYKNSMQEGLASQISAEQNRNSKLVQDIAELKMKAQSIDNNYSELRRQLGALKVYLPEIDSFAAMRTPGAGWQEQRHKQNLNNLLQRLKRMLRMSGLSPQEEQPSPAVSRPPALPTHPHPDYLKYYNQVYTALEQPKVEVQSHPYMVSSDPEEQGSRYHDYLQ